MMVKIMPTYATRKTLIDHRIASLRADAARYTKHGDSAMAVQTRMQWYAAADEARRSIAEAKLELKALVRT